MSFLDSLKPPKTVDVTPMIVEPPVPPAQIHVDAFKAAMAEPTPKKTGNP